MERKFPQKETSSRSLFPPEGLITLWILYDTKWIDLSLQPIFTKALFPRAAFSPPLQLFASPGQGCTPGLQHKHSKSSSSWHPGVPYLSCCPGEGTGHLQWHFSSTAQIVPTVQVMHKVRSAGSHPWVFSCQNWLLPDLPCHSCSSQVSPMTPGVCLWC